MSASRPASTDRAEVAPRTPLLRGGRETAPGSLEGSRTAPSPPDARRTASRTPDAPDRAPSPDDAPRSVPEAREAIAATRERLSHTADLLKRKLDAKKGRLGRRLDLATKLRRAIAGREALAAAGAFAAGLLLALAGRRKRLDRDDIKALRDWSKHRERLLAVLDELDEDD